MSFVLIPVGGGLVPDESQQDMGDQFWTAGSNVLFRDGFVQKAGGWRAAVTAPSGVPYMVASYPKGSTPWVIHATLIGVFSDDGTTKTTITGAALTGAATDKFTSTIFGGVFVFNNGKDAPRYWGGSGTTANLTGWPAGWTARSIRGFGYHLFALNVTKSGTNYGSQVAWSDAAPAGTIPSTWTPAASNSAGSFDLSDTPDVIVDAMPLGDMLVVYKERSAYGVQYIGATSAEIHRQWKLPIGYGMLAPNCGAVIPSGHVVLTPGPDVIFHDGSQAKSIVAGKWRTWLSNNLNSLYCNNAFLIANHRHSEVWICIPTIGQYCDKALVWNWDTGAFGVQDLPNVTSGTSGPLTPTSGATWDTLPYSTWEAWSGSWDAVDISQADRRLVMASSAPAIYLMDEGTQQAGADFTASVERIGMTFKAPDMTKLLQGVVPRIDGANGTVLTMQFGASMDAEKSPTWAPATTYTVGTTRRADCLVEGRFVSARIKSTGPGSWRIKTMSAEVDMTGEY